MSACMFQRSIRTKPGTLPDNSAVAFYRYKVIKEVGDGTFGSVWRAINKQTGEVVCS